MQLDTIKRLWAVRNMNMFTVKDTILREDDNKASIKQTLLNCVSRGELERNGTWHFEMTYKTKERLEDLYKFMKEHYHGQGL